ncbi:MAG: prepilin peptidase [Myxococcaceae bacterium]|jgi:prepilin peptidase CpaA|nr:prepilin peptidase [Myxococcaceae bacterium]
MTTVELVCFSLVALVVLAAAALDVRTRRYPAWLALGLLVSCLLARLALEGAGTAGTGLLAGLLGALGCAGPYALLALSGPRVGWGDVLLLAGVGAGLGFPRGLAAAFLISVVGAVAALVVLWRRRRSDTVAARGTNASVDSARAIPYGLPIALGAIWAMGWGGPALEPVTDEELEPGIELLDAGVEAGAGEASGNAPAQD